MGAGHRGLKQELGSMPEAATAAADSAPWVLARLKGDFPFVSAPEGTAMALDARRRSSIHNKLVPLLGEEDANAFMSEFPSVDAGGLVSAGTSRPGSSELRAECAALHADIAALSTELTWRFTAIIAVWAAVIGPLFLYD